jgi:hypothetical protein
MKVKKTLLATSIAKTLNHLSPNLFLMLVLHSRLMFMRYILEITKAYPKVLLVSLSKNSDFGVSNDHRMILKSGGISN